jgi:hypothetical protein
MRGGKGKRSPRRQSSARIAEGSLGLSFGAAASDDRTLERRAELAIGEYLARKKKIYADMPIARLLGALGRQGIASDEAARALQLIGARVSEVPTFVAKFNHRVTFTEDILNRCRQAYAISQHSAA